MALSVDAESHVRSGAVLASLHVRAVLVFRIFLVGVISHWWESYPSIVELHIAVAPHMEFVS